jgi:hypothetical protein
MPSKTGTGLSKTIFWKFVDVTSNIQSSFFAGVGAASASASTSCFLSSKTLNK